jgi:hypothetical protein
MKKGFLLGALLMVGATMSAAFAGVSNQVDLETSLEKRIVALVNRFDPMAIVRVSVNYKKISSPLPGTSIEVRDFSGSSGESFKGDINGANVIIYTSKDKFPEWLKVEIAKSVPEVRANIEFKNLTAEELAAIQPGDTQKINQTVELFLNKQADFNRSFLMGILWRLGLVFGVVGCAILLIGSVVSFALLKRRMIETNRVIESRIIPVLQNMSSSKSESEGSSKPTVLQATLTAPTGGFGGGGSGGGGSGSGQAQQDIANLTMESLEALFTDCYWCQNDGYASWLWSVMKPSQRFELMSSSKLDPAYIKAIQVAPKDRQDDHLHPVYLNPIAIHHLSQDDIGRWVEAFLPGFHLLSPMRQVKLPISLKTRLQCMSQALDSKHKVPAIPERPSTKRVLHAVQKLGDLTHEDETTVLHNPAMVPNELRSQIRSLVWLALKPFEFRQKALAEFSSEEIASAWSGSPEVLARLSEALPEKKRLMLEGYLQSIEVNKKAYVYSRLVEAGLSNQLTVVKDENQEREGAQRKVA